MLSCKKFSGFDCHVGHVIFLLHSNCGHLLCVHYVGIVNCTIRCMCRLQLFHLAFGACVHCSQSIVHRFGEFLWLLRRRMRSLGRCHFGAFALLLRVRLHLLCLFSLDDPHLFIVEIESLLHFLCWFGVCLGRKLLCGKHTVRRWQWLLVSG